MWTPRATDWAEASTIWKCLKTWWLQIAAQQNLFYWYSGLFCWYSGCKLRCLMYVFEQTLYLLMFELTFSQVLKFHSLYLMTCVFDRAASTHCDCWDLWWGPKPSTRSSRDICWKKPTSSMESSWTIFPNSLWVLSSFVDYKALLFCSTLT